jgi:phage baseplate assembly protein W
MSIARTSPYTDLDFSFKQNVNTNDVGIKRNTEAIKQSILNILKTNWGERPFNFYFGANLRSYLFENLDNVTAANISSSIKLALANHEPRAKVLNINIKAMPDDNNIEITLTIQILSDNEIIDVSTTLERIR